MGNDYRQAASSFVLVVLVVLGMFAASFAFRDAGPEHAAPVPSTTETSSSGIRPIEDRNDYEFNTELQSRVDAAYNDKLNKDAARDTKPTRSP